MTATASAAERRPPELFWYVIDQDGRYPWDPTHQRRVDHGYLGALARSLDHLGYDGALFATSVSGGYDPWITAASVLPYTERLRFLIAVHPSLTTPITFAKMAGTFTDLSAGRFLVNVVSGAGDLRPVGVPWDHDQRYAHTDEFLTVYGQLTSGERVDFAGNYINLQGATPPFPEPRRRPPLWFGGSSEPALDVAARHIDTYLTWVESNAQLAAKIADVRSRAAAHGRQIRFGLRLHVIVRDTEREAWAAAQDALDHMSDATINAVRAAVTAQHSVGGARQQTLYEWRRPQHARDLEIEPGLWAGLALVRPGPGMAVVGDPDTVAARLAEYHALGFDAFILSSTPLLEEAYRVAEALFPRLRPQEPVVGTAAG